MITIASLWLPIVLATVLVWIASALFWTVSPHHKTDFHPLPDEDDILAALRPKNLTPGMYWFPWARGGADMKEPEVVAKFEQGPVGTLTIRESGVPGMGKPMVLSVVYYLVISIVIAYVASRTLAPGAEYLTVFRLTGTVGTLAYGTAVIPQAIWFGTPWSNTWKTILDALVYGLLTAGVFGWLWG